MKKSYLSLRRQTVPALLCCLPLCIPLAAGATGLNTLGIALVAAPAQGITGRITDSKGEALPGVTVLVKGTSNGTSSGADGSFSLDAPADATLIISSVGYLTKEVAVNGQTSISVSLATDVQQLSEAVVVGYITQERQNVTGSVATVGAQEVRRAPVASVGEAIQGRMAGVQVTNSGQPGQAPSINIRGLGSVASGSGPLYVIDGLWIEGDRQGGQRDFNPSDVESVQVLKDAAALAPYGSSGANGVIIITTKKGRSGAPAITFNANGGVQNLVKRLDLANAAQWANVNNQAYDNAGVPRQPYAATLPGIDTDWQKEFFKQGSVQDYNLGFSGGGPNSNYNVSGGYFKQNGTVQGPKFDRYSVRVNTGFNRGRLKVGENLLLTRTNQTRLNGLPFIDILRMLPVIPVYDPTTPGGFGIGNNNAITFGTNPIALQSLLDNTGVSSRLQGNVYAEVSIFDFLRYRLNLATEYHGFHDQQKRQFGVWRRNDPTTPSSFGETQGTEVFGMAENTLTFDKSFGEHSLTVVGGYSQQRFRQELTRGVNFEYGRGPSYYWALDGGSQTPQVIGSTFERTKESYFGQLTYDYGQRYLLTAAYRRDGSSRFNPVKYGNFGAASLGWRVSKEKFFEGITGVSDLKLRASYGRLGNDLINGPYGGSYLYQGFINTNANYVLGGAIQNGAIQSAYASTGIRWEDRRTTNVGFDAGFLANRLTLSADYYVSQTINALINPDLPLTFGNAGANPFRNLGKLENKGFEFQLGYNDDRQKFRYGATANLTTTKNTVLDLGTRSGEAAGAPNFFNGGPGTITRTEVGQELGSFYLYQFDGIYQTGDANIPAGLKPGDVRYKDTNNDGKISDEDRVHVGRVFPKLQYGANLNLGYGGFDLAAFFQGVQGNDVFNTGKYWLERTDDNNNHRADFSPWTPTNPSITTPRALIAGGKAGDAPGNNDRFNSTRWLESGSYLRLKNLQLGFTVPKALLEQTKYVASLRVYATAQNLFTVTKYSGYDPETVGSGAFNSLGNNLARGVDEGSYPNLRSFTLGIQAGF